MDVTMYNLALLAHNLGYGWCASCRAEYVGEDFVRKGDTWEADNKPDCLGVKVSLGSNSHPWTFPDIHTPLLIFVLYLAEVPLKLLR